MERGIVVEQPGGVEGAWSPGIADGGWEAELMERAGVVEPPGRVEGAQSAGVADGGWEAERVRRVLVLHAACDLVLASSQNEAVHSQLCKIDDWAAPALESRI